MIKFPGCHRWQVKRLMVALVVAADATTGLAQADSIRLQPTIRRIDSLAAAEYARDSVGSVTIAIVDTSGILWTRSYGFADKEHRRLADRQSVYRIGSVTKMFTALMLIQLVERGTVHLTDAVDRYYPAIREVKGAPPWSPAVTLVQLATHTSGLAREPDDTPRYLVGAVKDWERVLQEALKHTRYELEPGTQYSYSNVGYAILGAALAHAAHIDYGAYLRQQILLPLGMTHTTLEFDPISNSPLAKGYVIGEKTVDTVTPAREHRGRGYKVPNGALYSSIDDLASFVRFELGSGPTLAGKATVDSAFSRGAQMNSAIRYGYGLGFQVFRRDNLVLFGHGGNVAGYEAALLFDRQSKKGFVALRNATGGTFDIGGMAVDAMVELTRPGTAH